MFLTLSGRAPPSPAFPLVWVLGDSLRGVSPGHGRRACLLQSPILPFEVTVVSRPSCPEAPSWVPRYGPEVVLGVPGPQSLLLDFSEVTWLVLTPDLRTGLSGGDGAQEERVQQAGETSSSWYGRSRPRDSWFRTKHTRFLREQNQ